MRIAFALPGFHKVERGAEVALLSVAEQLARSGCKVTVFGSGPEQADSPYQFRHVAAVPRERFEKFPFFPPLRSDTAWEDATFAAALLKCYRPADFDAVVTCSFPFTHWALRRPARSQPAQIFVTQNGDWPAFEDKSEYRTFRCDGLVCTNPDYIERNRDRWNCALIPNGIALSRFTDVPGDRAALGLPTDRPIVLMVSAFIETKRVLDGIRAVSQIDDAYLVVAGDGPLRNEGQELADRLMPGRFQRISLKAAQMPMLYASADAFLHLSLLESFGNVFLEAWASGLPIVAHDSERLRWILGNSGLLCDTENEAALISNLRRAIADGRGQPQSGIERYDWPVIAEEYRRFIDATITSRKQS